jgi:hypothetical protein
MSITREALIKWFDAYFDSFNRNNGPLATVVKMKQYFTVDLEFWPYNMPGPKPSNREALLITMVHPGLHEHLTPVEYTIDLSKMIAVVQFKVQFTDVPSGKVWPPKYTSTHYHLALDEANQPKIKKIIYFMEHRPIEESVHRPLWIEYREKEFAENGHLASGLK